MKNADRLHQQIDATRQHHIDRYRSWVAALAAGEKGPTAADVMETAAVLQIADPGKMLAADAKVWAEVLRDEQRAEREREFRRAALEPHGGEHGIQQLIEQKRAELAELERLANPWVAMAAGHADSRVHHAKRKNPRLYGEWPMPRPQSEVIYA